jgi:hypothetical protein
VENLAKLDGDPAAEIFAPMLQNRYKIGTSAKQAR